MKTKILTFPVTDVRWLVITVLAATLLMCKPVMVNAATHVSLPGRFPVTEESVKQLIAGEQIETVIIWVDSDGRETVVEYDEAGVATPVRSEK